MSVRIISILLSVTALLFGLRSASSDEPDEPAGLHSEAAPTVRHLPNFEVSYDLFSPAGKPPIVYLNSYPISPKMLTQPEMKRLYVLIRTVACACDDRYGQQYFLEPDTAFFRMLQKNIPLPDSRKDGLAELTPLDVCRLMREKLENESETKNGR